VSTHGYKNISKITATIDLSKMAPNSIQKNNWLNASFYMVNSSIKPKGTSYCDAGNNGSPYCNEIDFLEIQHIRKTPVGRLPYGLQKRVELGRALAAEPQILLLDEPMAGMNVEEKQDMCRFILDVNEQFGTTIVLIEHDMGVVMDISDRVVVLDYGKKIGDGTPDEIRSNQDVINAYLGVAH
jgi:ABC-type glutathione transport system ATPase component